MQQKYSILVVVIILLSSLSCTTEACSLAIHDWKSVFHRKLELSSPIFPIAEASAAWRSIPEGPDSSVIWISKHSVFSYLSSAFVPVFFQLMSALNRSSHIFLTPVNLHSFWLDHIPWLALSSTDSVASLAHQKADKSFSPIIIGSDKNFLRIALFVDANSDNRCFQLVIMQQGRIRLVHANPAKPWAQELQASAFISIIFYELPLPERIMSLSLYPIAEHRAFLIDSEPLILRLLEGGALKSRPPSDYDPSSFELPEFPE